MTKDLFNPAALKEFRTELGLTLGQLAAAVGVSEVTVRTWEAGRYRPNKHNLTRLALALHTHEYELLLRMCPVCGQEVFADHAQ